MIESTKIALFYDHVHDVGFLFSRKSLLCNGAQSRAFQVWIFVSLNSQLVQLLFYSVVGLGLSTNNNQHTPIKHNSLSSSNLL